MKCPLMFGGEDVFCNGRECIGTACMWRIEATDHNGNKTRSCAVPMMVAQPGLSIGVQLSDKPDKTGVE